MATCACWKTHGKSCVCEKNREQANWVLCILFLIGVSLLFYKGCSMDKREREASGKPARVEQAVLIKT